jgi:ppGpp synthetase/RelA/SpoT-type nucleotidyltranferase
MQDSGGENGMQAAEPNKHQRIRDWQKQYKDAFWLWDEYTGRLSELISELIHQYGFEIAQLECRTKTVDSFNEKLTRKGDQYLNPMQDVTDFAGIRIVTYYREEVEKIGTMIADEFDVDWENSIDISQSLDPDTFGYISVHYVVSLSASRSELTEWEPFKTMKAEIQVRTVLQHAWAAMQHTLMYKPQTELPVYARRQLFRLSALLELADEQFSGVRRLMKNINNNAEQADNYDNAR